MLRADGDAVEQSLSVVVRVCTFADAVQLSLSNRERPDGERSEIVQVL